MKKALSLLLVIALFALSGCVEVIKPTLWEIDGEAVSIDEYKAFLYSSLIPAKNQYSEEDWNAEKDGKTTFEQMKDGIYDEVLQIYTVAKMAEKEGITADFSVVSSIKSSLVSASGLSESEFIKEADITSEALSAAAKKLATYQQYMMAKQESGEYTIDQTEVSNRYKNNYFRAKHILISTIDNATGAPLAEEQIAEKKAKAEDILSKVNSSNFDALMKENTEDPGSEASPDGYVFTEGEMVPEFEESVKSLDIGGISGLVETSYGYHIITRLALPENSEDQNYMNAISAIESELFVEAVQNEASEFRKTISFTEHKEFVDEIKKD